MKQCFKSLLASLLLSMPLFDIQAAAEIGPDNIYQILSGIEDLQDGSWRSIEKANHICNDSVLNVDLHSLFAELATAGEEGHKLLLRIETEFHIVIPGIIQPPLVDDSDEEGAGADPDGEVTGTEKRTPELPDDVLAFLYCQFSIPPGLRILPTELIARVLYFNSECIHEIADNMTPSELSEVEPVILSGSDGSPIKASYAFFNEEDKCIFVLEKGQVNCRYNYNYQGTLIKSVDYSSVLAEGDDILESTSEDEDHDHAPLDTSKKSIDDFAYTRARADYTFACTMADSDDSTEDRIFICKKGSNKHIGIDKNLHYHLLDNKKNPIVLTDATGKNLICASIHFGPKEQLIAAEDQEGHWHLFDNQHNPIVLTDAAGNNLICASIHFGPKGQLTAAKDQEGHWHLFDSQHHPIALINVDGNNLTVNKIIFCSDGQLIAACGPHWLYHLFDSQGNRISLVDDPNGHIFTYSKLEFSPNGTYIAVQDLVFPQTPQKISKGLRLFNNQRDLIKQIPIELSSFIFSPDEQYLLVINEQGICYLYNIPKDQISILKDIKENQIIGKYTHRSEFSCDGHCLLIQDIDYHCYVFTVTEHKNIQYQLKRGITTDALLMLKLLGGLKKNWEQDYPHVPFSTCPADITCALISPLFSEIDFEKTKVSQTKARVKQVHTWVLWTLESLKNIELTSSQTLFNVLCEAYNLEKDPLVRHPDYEANGHIAPGHLIPYVRLKNRIHIRKMEEALQEASSKSQEDLTKRLETYDRTDVPTSFFDAKEKNESDDELFGASSLMEID